GTHVNLPVENQWRGFNRAGGLVGPELPAVGKVQPIDVSVVRADEDTLADDGCGGLYRPFRFEAPEQGEFEIERAGRDPEQGRTAAKHRPTRRARLGTECDAAKGERRGEEQSGPHD